MDYHVIDHHHDPDAGVYRLRLGRPIEVQRPVTNDKGEPVLEHVPLLQTNGEPVRDVDGKEVVLHGGQLYEAATEYADVQEIVFADDDPEWKGKPQDEVAQAQRARVKEQFAAREKEARAAAKRQTKLKQLPGSGEAL